MNNQKTEWETRFGREYTQRNMFTPAELDQLYLDRYGVTRTGMNHEFLDFLDRDIMILEVGSNIGNQLHLLHNMGFKNLYGIEINSHAIEKSNKLNCELPIYVIKGEALNIPFKDSFFDLIYTSGVLIHINPKNIGNVISEIFRCSKRYIWGFEYFQDEGYNEIEYHGQNNMLWKTDFKKLYLENHPELKLIKEKHYHYLENNHLTDQMFLLEK
ncbi:MAG: methyltransferase domain-containing protein [Methanobacterium sp.]|jgi:pseudaminic acid biosynthesis-associated methylase|nr:methyltransferase domain-containing protein [Methanobacterium sp.]